MSGIIKIRATIGTTIAATFPTDVPLWADEEGVGVDEAGTVVLVGGGLVDDEEIVGRPEATTILGVWEAVAKPSSSSSVKVLEYGISGGGVIWGTRGSRKRRAILG